MYLVMYDMCTQKTQCFSRRLELSHAGNENELQDISHCARELCGYLSIFKENVEIRLSSEIDSKFDFVSFRGGENDN